MQIRKREPRADGTLGPASRDQILIVTADDRTVGLMSKLFKRAGYSSGAVASGEEAFEAVRTKHPSLIFLDLQLRDMTGYEVCYRLREEFAEELSIVFMSGERKESLDRVAGLLIGADDYVTKPFDPDELLARARRLLARTPRTSKSSDSSLTARELQVLRLLARGMGQARIAKELVISSKTVGTHIQRILAKLRVHSRTQAVAFAYQEGLIE